jgi:hypothetical protein
MIRIFVSRLQKLSIELEGYYRSTKQILSQDIARTELAKRLVQLSREGIQDERLLAKAGFRHLQELGRD